MSLSRIQEYLASLYSHLEPQQVLSAPPSALLGVSPQALRVLGELDINCIFDLAVSRVFGAAAELALDGENGLTHRYGKPGADTVDSSYEDTEVAQLANADVQALTGVGERTDVSELKQALHVQTVRDLALWPPYRAARDIAARVLLPETTVVDDGVPPDLLPRSGEYATERVFYQSLVVGQELGRDDPGPTGDLRRPLPSKGTRDIAAATQFDPLTALGADTGYTRTAVGACLTFSQSWYTHGVTLGQLLHSVALAPGESTRIAVIDWARQSTGAQMSTDQQSESLSQAVGRNRSISEVVSSVATETQAGEFETNVRSTSESLGVSVTAGTPGVGATASYGLTDTEGRTWGHTTSAGRRDVGAQMTQSVVDRTHQAANAARNRRASVVREVSEKESEVVSTRVVANYNHMHALSVQYYEVVQAYRMLTRLERADQCLFLPMKLVEFGDPTVLGRIRSVLARAALNPVIANDLDAGMDRVVMRGPEVSATGHGFNPFGGTGMRDVGRRVTGPSPELALLPSGTGFWFGSGSADAQVTRVDGIRHVGDQRVLHYRAEDYDTGSWPTRPIEGVAPGNLPVADLSEFRSLRVVFESREGHWEAEGELTVSCNFYPPTYSGYTTANSVTLHYSVRRDAGTLAVVEFDLSGGPVAGDALLDHLRSNAYHYSQAVWQSLDAAVLAGMLDGYTMNGRPLTQLVDLQPLGTTGNYLVFRIAGGEDDPSWERWLDQHGIRVGHVETAVVPLPSGGVFAEAVLGRANSAEKIDLTRFWDWQDSPLPLTAPDIAPIGTGSRHQTEPLEHMAGAQHTLNVISPSAVPDPLGVTAALTALGNKDLFRDMSGTQVLSALTRPGSTARNATEIGGLANLGRDMDNRAKKDAERATEHREPADDTAGDDDGDRDSAVPGGADGAAGPAGWIPAALPALPMESTLVLEGLGAGGGWPRDSPPTIVLAADKDTMPLDEQTRRQQGPKRFADALLDRPTPLSEASVELFGQIKDRLDVAEDLPAAMVLGAVVALLMSTPEETAATQGYDVVPVVEAAAALSGLIRERLRTNIGLYIWRPDPRFSRAEARYWTALHELLSPANFPQSA